MRKILLKTVDINDEIFYKLLKMHKHCVKIVNNIHDYFYGYKDKTNIFNKLDNFGFIMAKILLYVKNIDWLFYVILQNM